MRGAILSRLTEVGGRRKAKRSGRGLRYLRGMRYLGPTVLCPLLLLLTACTSGPNPPADTAPPQERYEKPAKPGLGVVVLREVRAAGQPGFDRVAFEFEGSDVPGYRIGYVDKAIQCGSGEPVELAGEAWLEVQLTPAQAHTEAGEPTVRERERSLDLPVLKELESTCDFEADVTWVLGLASRKVYRVQELANPARLVIDLEH